MVSQYSSNTTPLKRNKGEKKWFWTVRGLVVAHSSYMGQEETEPQENPPYPRFCLVSLFLLPSLNEAEDMQQPNHP